MFTVPNSLNHVPSPLKRLPSIMAFGTRFPSKFWYPSQLDRYKPLSMPTLQPRASTSARTVAGVPCAIAVTRVINAHANTNEAIALLTNFLFITVISFHCFGLSWLLVIEKSFLAVH